MNSSITFILEFTSIERNELYLTDSELFHLQLEFFLFSFSFSASGVNTNAKNTATFKLCSYFFIRTLGLMETNSISTYGFHIWEYLYNDNPISIIAYGTIDGAH